MKDATPAQPGAADRPAPASSPKTDAATTASLTGCRRPFWRWLLLAAVVILIDQATKLWFEAEFTYGQRLNVLPFFDFTLVYNPGAAFSFLADAGGWQRWFFTLLGLGASGFILWLLRRHGDEPRFALAMSLILGGAIGNVIDRMSYGHVIDFLLFYWNNAYFPAFNLADSALTLGAILMILDELLKLRRRP
ncbi:lipoprotein signal peptidase [Alcaligenaceae bacterium SJ-26]|nr:lipoprotein signal peptidase [Alcaligenaceae bacterium SJ-26]